MPSPARFASFSLLFLSLLTGLGAQTDAPSSAEKSTVADLESKLSTALRSYSLLDAELDRLKAANAQLVADKAALEAKVAEVQAAVPLAAQAVALREQLRQTQAQMAAYAEENSQLKTKLALAGPDTAHPSHQSNTTAPTTTNASVAAAAPAPTPSSPRTHVIVEGDTLVKISEAYYGTPNRWNEILAANRDVLRDEKSLVIGRSLIVP